MRLDTFSFLQAQSINEFLKPAEGESYYRPGGRGRGRGRGRGNGGGYGGISSVSAPSIEDVGQFPSLAVKKGRQSCMD